MNSDYCNDCYVIDSPGCECGFMSMERIRVLMRLLQGEETAGNATSIVRKLMVLLAILHCSGGMPLQCLICCPASNGAINLKSEKALITIALVLLPAMGVALLLLCTIYDIIIMRHQHAHVLPFTLT